MRKVSFYLCIACIVFLFIALLCQFYGDDRAGENPAKHNGIEGQITHSAELVKQAGEQNKSAIQSADRAGEYTEQAIQSNKSAQAILAELRADNRRAKQIIDEIIRGTQEGK